MPNELTIRMGGEGDLLTMRVEWNDHNNVQHRETISFQIGDWDKPRTFELCVGGRCVYVNRAGEKTYA